MSSSFDNKVYEYISNNGSTPTPTPSTDSVSIYTQTEGVYQLTLTNYSNNYATLLIKATVQVLTTESITFSDELTSVLGEHTPITCQILNNKDEITDVSVDNLTYTIYFTSSEASSGITFTNNSVSISISSAGFPNSNTYYFVAYYYLA